MEDRGVILYEVGMRVRLTDELLEKDPFPKKWREGRVVKVKRIWCKDIRQLSQHIWVAHSNGIWGWLAHEIEPVYIEEVDKVAYFG